MLTRLAEFLRTEQLPLDLKMPTRLVQATQTADRGVTPEPDTTLARTHLDDLEAPSDLLRDLSIQIVTLKTGIVELAFLALDQMVPPEVRGSFRLMLLLILVRKLEKHIG